MTPTITQYQPGIYATLARRAEARQAREERLIRLIDLCADTLLAVLALVWLGFVAWLTLSLVLP